MRRMIIAAAASLIAFGAPSRAQEWPARPLTLIVPFAADGGVDVSARVQAQRMGELLGQSMVVENTSVMIEAQQSGRCSISPRLAAPIARSVTA